MYVPTYESDMVIITLVKLGVLNTELINNYSKGYHF